MNAHMRIPLLCFPQKHPGGRLPHTPCKELSTQGEGTARRRIGIECWESQSPRICPPLNNLLLGYSAQCQDNCAPRTPGVAPCLPTLNPSHGQIGCGFGLAEVGCLRGRRTRESPVADAVPGHTLKRDPHSGGEGPGLSDRRHQAGTRVFE